jgi:Flp pilus assembly protein TadD
MKLKLAASLAVMAGWGILMMLRPTVPPATAAELADVAIGFIKSNHHSEALGVLNDALAVNASDFRANYVAGVYAMQTKRFQEAEPYLRAALKAKPDDVETLLSLGVVCQAQGKFQEARATYLKGRSLDPKNTKLVYNLGMLCIRVLDYPVARKYFQEYLQLNPKAGDRSYVKSKIRKLDQFIGDKK